MLTAPCSSTTCYFKDSHPGGKILKMVFRTTHHIYLVPIYRLVLTIKIPTM